MPSCWPICKLRHVAPKVHPQDLLLTKGSSLQCAATARMPSAGTTSTEVHLCWSPSYGVRSDPPGSGPVAVLPRPVRRSPRRLRHLRTCLPENPTFRSAKCERAVNGGPVSPVADTGSHWMATQPGGALLAEGGPVIRLAAGHQCVRAVWCRRGPPCSPQVPGALRIASAGSGKKVSVRPCVRPASHQGPRALADDRGRITRLEKRAGELHCHRHYPQLVRTGYVLLPAACSRATFGATPGGKCALPAAAEPEAMI
jgi:hypothetical protein